MFENTTTVAAEVQSGPRRIVFEDKPAPVPGPRKIVFEQESKVSDEGEPRKVSFPASQPSTPAQPASSGPRRIDMPSSPPADPTPAPASGPRRIDMPASPAPAPAPVSSGPRAISMPPSPPPPPAPVQTGPRSISMPGSAAEARLEAQHGKIKTPEEARYERLLHRAAEVNAQVGSNPKFAPRLKRLLEIPSGDWFNWGQETLDDNKAATDGFAEINRELATLDATRWISDTKDAAVKPPSMLDRFTRKPPAYYEAKLAQIKDSLKALIPAIDGWIAKMTPINDRMIFDVIALQVGSEGLTKPMEMQIADNRLRILLGAQQSMFVTLTGLENAKVAIVQNIQTIDMLLTQTIPQWAVAQSHIR